MSFLRRLLVSRVTPDCFDVRIGQYVCYAAGPALLAVALNGIARIAPTRMEAILGVLASIAVAMLFILLGIVMPLTHASPRREK